MTDGPVAGEPEAPHWLATAAVEAILLGPVAVRVTVVSGVVTVYVKGVQVLSIDPVTVGPTALLGFTGSTMHTHASIGTKVVSAVSVTGPGTGTMVGDPASGGWSATLVLAVRRIPPAHQGGLRGQGRLGVLAGPVDSVGPQRLLHGDDRAVARRRRRTGARPGRSHDTAEVGRCRRWGTGVLGNRRGRRRGLDTYQNNVNPSANFVGATTGPITPSVPDELDWLATDDVGVNLRSTNTVTVTLVSGVLTVSVDGTVALTTPVTVGPQVLLGFTGGEGMLTDNHLVSGVSASAD